MWSTSATIIIITTITPGCKQPKNSNKPEWTVWLTSRKAVFQWQRWKHNDCIFLASVTDCKFLTKVCNTPYLHVALRWGFDNTPYLHVALRWGSDRHLTMYTTYTSTVVSLLWTSVRCTRLGVLFTGSCQSQPVDYSATAQGVWHGGERVWVWVSLGHCWHRCVWGVSGHCTVWQVFPVLSGGCKEGPLSVHTLDYSGSQQPECPRLWEFG